MKFVKESIDRFFDYDLHIETRTLYIGENDDKSINADVAKHTIKALHILNAINKEEINIILNSGGGDWFHGMAIYDAIMASSCHITASVYGCAMSMGSIILQAADTRIIHPNGTMMLHDGYETRVDDIPKTFQNWADYSKTSQRIMYEIYAKRSGRPPSFWRKKCSSDLILTSKLALELGLVDKIFSQ